MASLLSEFRNHHEEDKFGDIKDKNGDREGSREVLNKEIQHLRAVRDLVQSVKLLGNSTDDEEAELEKRKEEVEKSLAEVLKAIKNYKLKIDSVEDDIKALYKNAETHKNIQEEISKLDRIRKMAHDSLVDAVKRAVGFINYNFGNINSKILADWEDKQTEQGKILLDIKRVDLPKNVICPDDVSLSDRKSIAGWAFKLSKIDKI